MTFTIRYQLPSGRFAYHTTEGEKLTEFLRNLNANGIQWTFHVPDRTPLIPA